MRKIRFLEHDNDGVGVDDLDSNIDKEEREDETDSEGDYDKVEELEMYRVIIDCLEVGRGLTQNCLKIHLGRQLEVLVAANPHR